MEKYPLKDYIKGADSYILFEDGRVYSIVKRDFLKVDDTSKKFIRYNINLKTDDKPKRFKLYPHRILYGLRKGLTIDDLHYLRLDLKGDKNDFSDENYDIKVCNRRA